MPEEPAFILQRDVGRFERYERGYYADLWIENVPMYMRLTVFHETPVDAPDPVIFRGNLAIVRTVDFPVTDNSWIVMSRKMLDVLKSAGDFRHLEFPVVIVDSRLSPDQWYDESGKPREEAVLHGYVAVQLLERPDIFDYERSKYRPDPDFPFIIGNVDEYVFKISESGLPPIFHIEGEPVKIFISHKARMALKKAGVTGVAYIPLEGIKQGKGLFVDVETTG